MMQATLTRYYSSSSGSQDMPLGTRGLLRVGDSDELHTLELPWRDNEPNVSCIPSGVYVLTPHARGYLITGGTCVNDKASLGIHGKRYGCLIHSANFPWEIQGCIAPGMSRGTQVHADGSIVCSVWDSRVAVALLRGLIGDSPCELTVQWI